MPRSLFSCDVTPLYPLNVPVYVDCRVKKIETPSIMTTNGLEEVRNRVDPLLDEEYIGNIHFGNFHLICGIKMGELGERIQNGPNTLNNRMLERSKSPRVDAC